MDKRLEQTIRRRARDVCEYCRMSQAWYRPRFVIDHIIARQHGGASVEDNLALCCLSCNRYKGPNIAGIDPMTGQLTPLFNPRQHRWRDHFVWHGPELVGLTPDGRATISVLQMNNPKYLVVRKALITEGVFPSPDEP